MKEEKFNVLAQPSSKSFVIKKEDTSRKEQIKKLKEIKHMAEIFKTNNLYDKKGIRR